MDDDTIYVTLTLSLENIDVILNALEEKVINIQSLRQNIYNVANNQIEIIKQEREKQLLLKNSVNGQKGKEKEQMENIKLICKDCGKEFDFTIGEQKFYADKGFAQPIRCKECRDIKKARHTITETSKSDNDFEEMFKKFQQNTVKLEK